MAADNITPEERLFKVIREEKGSKGAKKAPRSFGLPEMPRFELPAVGMPEISFDAKIKALVFIAAALIAAIFYSAVFGRKDVSGVTVLTPKGSQRRPAYEAASSLKSLDFYIGQLKKRDILRPAPQGSPQASAGYGISEAIKNLSLAGIYWADEPEVMIEDKAAKKIFFAKKGSQVNALTVEDILKDRVILKYGSDTAELS